MTTVRFYRLFANYIRYRLRHVPKPVGLKGVQLDLQCVGIQYLHTGNFGYARFAMNSIGCPNNISKIIICSRRFCSRVTGAIQGVLKVLCGNFSAVGELHTLPNLESVCLAIRANRPALRHCWLELIGNIPFNQPLVNLLQQVDGGAISHHRRVERGWLRNNWVTEYIFCERNVGFVVHRSARAPIAARGFDIPARFMRRSCGIAARREEYRHGSGCGDGSVFRYTMRARNSADALSTCRATR